jgi:hypothetical protein
MHNALRLGVIVLGLLGGFSPALAAENTNTGAVSADKNTGVAAAGPIGATGHTMPAKFSAENAALDNLPTMARLPPLNDEQKRTVYDTLSASSEPAAQNAAVGPATELPADIAMHDLPEAVAAQLPALKGYKFVRFPDRIVIVGPPNRIVVGEIAK